MIARLFLWLRLLDRLPDRAETHLVRQSMTLRWREADIERPAQPAASVESDPKTVVMPISLARLSLMATRQKSFDRFAKSALDARNRGRRLRSLLAHSS